MSHHNYNNHGRSSRPSHTGGDSHSGSFLEQGRTILPPLTIAFPTSDSPVPGNYSSPYPTQQRSTPVPYEQPYYSSAQQPRQAGYAQTGYHSYHQQVPDARYPQAYSSYNRASPSSSSADPRQLRPLSVPRDDRGQSSQYYQPPHADLQMPSTTSDMRSPHAVYSPAGLSAVSIPFPRVCLPTELQSRLYSCGGGSSYSRSIPQLPYARNAPAMSPVDYEPPTDPAEPTIKKKRKRADARQLEVLNATYNRTAFPSTEERAALAKQLDMSARSVQIWFQNKRQAMRQGGRATTSGTNPVSNPGPAPVPTPTPPVAGYRASPALMSPMVQQSGPTYSSRSPPPMVRTGQTPSPPSGRSRADIDPRTGRHMSGPYRGY
ncbi:homeobox-domain-containing protein [Lactarius psammicola]|nr:homeobox-domain-containing protein [Lactarius psammicola]